MKHLSVALAALSRRWFWLRHDITRWLASWKNPPGDPGKNFKVIREYRGWTVRPQQGWRRHRWVSLPVHYTRSVPTTDRDAAVDWSVRQMGL